MKRNIKTLLHSMGVYQNYAGYRYFVAAVELAAVEPARLTHMRQEIYFPVAEKFNVSIMQVERDIRTIRDVVVRNGGIKLLEEISGEKFFLNEILYPREIIEIVSHCIEQ